MKNHRDETHHIYQSTRRKLITVQRGGGGRMSSDINDIWEL